MLLGISEFLELSRRAECNLELAGEVVEIVLRGLR